MKYQTQGGVCAQLIEFEITDGRVRNVHFTGGCNGNAKGVCSLVEGMKVDEVITKLAGIHCGFRQTSCPDQLATALKKTLAS